MFNSAHRLFYISKLLPILLVIIGFVLGPLTSYDSILFFSILALCLWQFGKPILIGINNQVHTIRLDLEPKQEIEEYELKDTDEDDPIVEPELEQEEGIVLAFDKQDRPIVIPDLTSLGVGGKPGMGKTVAMTWLGTQLVLDKKGKIRFVVLDPHKPNILDSRGESLAERINVLAPFYLRGPAENPSGKKGMLLWVQWLKKEIDRRIEGGRSSWDEYIVVLADEFASIMLEDSLAKDMSYIMEQINTQARKIGIFAIVASPIWKGTRVDTELRSSINTFLLFNMDQNVVRQIVPDEQIAKQVARLPKYYVVLVTNDSSYTGRVKMLSQSDIQNAIERYLPTVIDSKHPATTRYAELTVRAKLGHSDALLLVAKEMFNGNEEEALQVLKEDLNG